MVSHAPGSTTVMVSTVMIIAFDEKEYFLDTSTLVRPDEFLSHTKATSELASP